MNELLDLETVNLSSKFQIIDYRISRIGRQLVEKLV